MIKMEGESRNSVTMEITQASWAVLTKTRKDASILIKVSVTISSWFILVLNSSHRFQTGWQTGWYADKARTFDGTKDISEELTIHGVAQYGQASAKHVIVEIETGDRPVYFTLNKAIGINKDTPEGANRVMVVTAIRRDLNNVVFSDLRKKLASGRSWTKSLAGDRTLKIKVLSIDSSDTGGARVLIESSTKPAPPPEPEDFPTYAPSVTGT